MKYTIKSECKHGKGFIFVASLDVTYYELALYACQSLKDHFPDSHVTLFTHEKFLDGKENIFDNVIVDIPVYYRTKMWAMARTPYEKTAYIDADSFIASKKIKQIHDYLNDCDMLFCPVINHTAGNINLSFMDKAFTEPPKHHGAVCAYNKTTLTIDFLETWYTEYIKQVNTPWAYEEYHKDWRIFDMFTLYRMTNPLKFKEFSRFLNLNIKQLPHSYIISAQNTYEEKQMYKPIIHLIDKSTLKRIPIFWNKIEKKKSDEKYNFNRSLKAPSEFN